MKLAEALLLRSDQQKKIISLKQRINANVLVQDGDQPSEDPNELLKQVFSLIQELTKLNDGRSLLALLSLRDEFVEQHKTLTAAISNTSRESDRYSTREIKWHKVIPVSSLQKQADDISLKLRDLNVLIQSNNWKIDLIEA